MHNPIITAPMMIATGVILYLGYAIITTVSTPVAIIIGAVIIGLCILVAASSA